MKDEELRLLFVSAVLADGMGVILRRGEIDVQNRRAVWPLVVDIYPKNGSRNPDAVAQPIGEGRIAVEYCERHAKRKGLKNAFVGGDGWILSPECVRLNGGRMWDIGSE